MNATGRIVPLGADTHQAVQALLPWYVRETLEPAERERLATHLEACPHCQAELEWERRLQAAHQQLPGRTGDVDAALAAVHAQIAALPRERCRTKLRAAWSWWCCTWQRGAAAWHWVVAAQAAVIALLGVALWQEPPVTYRALGTASPAVAGNAVVMFRAGTTEQALRQALQQAGVRVVDGPTAAGAYVVWVADEAALQRLRADSAVALAQSLGSPEAAR